MRAARIAKLVKASKNAIVNEDKHGRQWVGTWRYFYLADESIELTQENVLGILDIEAEKRDEIDVQVNQYDGVTMELLDINPLEGDMLLIPKMSVTWGGDLLTIMRTEDSERTVMVPQRAIHPADGKNGLGFYLRGGSMVAAFEDLFCCALIAPLDQETQKKVIARIHEAIGEADDASAQEIIRAANERVQREHERAEAAVRQLVQSRQAQE